MLAMAAFCASGVVPVVSLGSSFSEFGLEGEGWRMKG